MNVAAISLIIQVLCLLSAQLQTGARTQAIHPTSLPTGKVKGRVLDFDTQNREFLLEGEGVRQVVQVDEDGNYQIDLPVGIYHIIMQGVADGGKNIPSDSIFRRASFRVTPNSTVEINLSSLRDRVYCTRFGKVLHVTVNDLAEEVKYPRPKYETFWLPSSTKEPRDIVVEYCGKKKLSGSIVYTNATLTHDKLTITATYLQLNDKTTLLHARGSEVIIEDGSKMITVKEATVKLATNQISYPRHKKRKLKLQ